jgi:hypothetical protein
MWLNMLGILVIIGLLLFTAHLVMDDNSRR